MASSNQRKKKQIQEVLIKESKPLTAQKISQKTHIQERQVLRFLTNEDEPFIKKTAGGKEKWTTSQLN